MRIYENSQLKYDITLLRPPWLVLSLWPVHSCPGLSCPSAMSSVQSMLPCPDLFYPVLSTSALSCWYQRCPACPLSLHCPVFCSGKFCPALSCPFLPCNVKSSTIKICPDQSISVMSCQFLSCPVLNIPVLSCPLLSYPVHYCPDLSISVLYCPLLTLPPNLWPRIVHYYVALSPPALYGLSYLIFLSWFFFFVCLLLACPVLPFLSKLLHRYTA